jgi:hypothetical protein
VAGNRRTLVKRAAVTGARQRMLTSTVCGQRSLFVRVTQKGKPGLVTVAASTP